MRLDGPVKDLTEAQKKQADIAGVPANRPGLGDEYPKMVYRPGKNARHMHLGEAIPIGNGAYDKVADKLLPGEEYETGFVDSAEDEAEAIENGWLLSIDPDVQARQALKREVERAKDDRIAELEAQLQAQQGQDAIAKRGPGRPPANAGGQ